MTATLPAASAMSVGETTRRARRRLADAGVDTPDLDARLLVAHATGLDRVSMITESRAQLDCRVAAEVEALLVRRIAGEPVGRILGRREFWGLDFALGPETLEPRPDSETIISAALEFIDAGPGREAPLEVADLGTGTGCLLIALLSELPRARGAGVDISQAALEVARRNAAANGVADRARFALGSWTAGLQPEPSHAGFDVIVANPPYIESMVLQTLSRDVAGYDPPRALDGGADGLEAYRAILANVKALLAPAGALILEVGQGQRARVCDLARRAGMATTAIGRDLGGVERAVTVR